MRILPLHPDIVAYIQKRELRRKFTKQLLFLQENMHHPSLGVELLEPRSMRIYSFRVDKKYRAVFIFRDSSTIEVIDVNDHYQ